MQLSGNLIYLRTVHGEITGKQGSVPVLKILLDGKPLWDFSHGGMNRKGPESIFKNLVHTSL